MKDGKNIIIAALLVAVLVMSVGYSAFATRLTLNGSAEITGEWDVEITKIVPTEVKGTADPGTYSFTNTTATFDADLLKPGDSVTYTITVQNKGTIDATLTNSVFTPDEGGPHAVEDGQHAIEYSNTTPATDLTAGATTTFTVTVTYRSSVDEAPEVTARGITAVIEYSQKK